MKEKLEFTLDWLDRKDFLEEAIITLSPEEQQEADMQTKRIIRTERITYNGVIKELKEFQQGCGMAEGRRRVLQQEKVDDMVQRHRDEDED